MVFIRVFREIDLASLCQSSGIVKRGGESPERLVTVAAQGPGIDAPARTGEGEYASAQQNLASSHRAHALASCPSMCSARR